jgi:pimeloyl-ACP methyl ester carboxylesterase
MVKITKHIIDNDYFKVMALSFLPETDSGRACAVMTHGYTSHKITVLPWAVKLAENGIPAIIFDLPGHYLASFEDVTNFDDFRHHAHELYWDAYQILNSLITKQNERIVITAGHSLGALLSMKALEQTALKNFSTLSVAVGFGLNPDHDTHLFDTDFYKKTLEVRNQLVSPALNKDVMFKWIKDEKANLMLSHRRIHLISGMDDLVVGEKGVDVLAEILNKLGNQITIEKPLKLPHHKPEDAAAHVNAFIRRFLRGSSSS